MQFLPEKNKDEILALGQKFNFVTSETSLLVLETVEQHAEHMIEPAKSRKEMYEAYHKLKEDFERRLENWETEKVALVEQMWEGR